MKKRGKNIFVILILVVIILIFFYFKFSIKRNRSVLSDTIEEEVSKVLEISTVKYNYTNVVAYKDNKTINGFNVPFTNKGFLIKYEGYLKAGIDGSNMEVTMLEPKSVEIKLDKPKIFDNVINEEDIYVYNEKESVFNKLELQEVYDIMAEEKKKVEKDIIEKGFLDEAEENAEDIIVSLLEGLGFDDIKIKYRN